jgi:hypothetical protein
VRRHVPGAPPPGSGPAPSPKPGQEKRKKGKKEKGGQASGAETPVEEVVEVVPPVEEAPAAEPDPVAKKLRNLNKKLKAIDGEYQRLDVEGEADVIGIDRLEGETWTRGEARGDADAKDRGRARDSKGARVAWRVLGVDGHGGSSGRGLCLGTHVRLRRAVAIYLRCLINSTVVCVTTGLGIVRGIETFYIN